MKRSKENIRVSLDITPRIKKILDKLVEEEGVNQSDILRRAISLYVIIKKGQKNEEEPALVKNGKILSKIIAV